MLAQLADAFTVSKQVNESALKGPWNWKWDSYFEAKLPSYTNAY